jgi:hypothetical protein
MKSKEKKRKEKKRKKAKRAYEECCYLIEMHIDPKDNI